MEMTMAVHHRHHDQQQRERKSSKIKNKKLFLENYLAFHRSRDLQSLNIQQLKQIISIHGFKQFKNRKEVEEAVSMINNPIDPIRSTLKENISSNAFVKLHEAIKDLTSLNWQECSITSIRSINSQNYHFNSLQISPPIETQPVTPKAKKTTSKKQTMAPITDSLSSGSGPITKTISDEAGSSVSMAAEGSGDGGERLLRLKKRKRKSVKNLHCVGETAGGSKN